MPTQNPRLTVTLKPSTHAQLEEVSRLTGDSKSALIAQILEQAHPVFDRLVKVLQAAEQAKHEVRAKASADLENAQARIERQLGLMLGEFDVATGDLLQQAEEVRRRGRRRVRGAGDSRAAAAASTPPSNRGVRSTANPVKKAKAKGGK